MNKKTKYTLSFISFSLVILIWIASLSLSKQKEVTPQKAQSHYIISREDSIRCLQELCNDIDAILSKSLSSNTKCCVLVYSLNQNKMIYSKNPDVMLTPASITKLITTFIAFSELGAEYKINTAIYTDAKEIHNGILEGNIYIVGHGDALFTSSDLDTLVEHIKMGGIKSIKGNIYGDGSFFDGKYNRQDYSGDADNVEDMPPISALSMDNNTATVIIKGGSGAQVLPLSTTLKAVSKVSSSKKAISKPKKQPIKKKKKNTSLNRINYNNYAGDVPLPPLRKKRGRVRLSSSLNEKGEQLFFISGSIGSGGIYTYFYPFLKPELAIAGALKYGLIANGINVEGQVLESNLTKESKGSLKQIAVFERPMAHIINLLVKNSNNYLAENIFKLVGAHTALSDNNARSAKLSTIRAFNKIGLKSALCELNDGSGLSRRNKLSGSTVMELLVSAAELPFFSKFDSSLAIAGYDGTIKGRMQGTLAEFNLHAKTGTLRDASGLAGYVYTLDSERLAFVMLFNGPSVSNYKEIENQIGQLLAQFFYYNENN